MKKENINIGSQDFIKDYTDESVDNNIKIELIFKKGFNPRLETVASKVNVQTTLVPNYTLIAGKTSDTRGVKIFQNPESILEVFYFMHFIFECSHYSG